jgi:DnaJ-class molecular chaperone
MIDYYNILGIKENASKEEIKKAYRGLSLKYHPDKTSDPVLISKFSEINEAYETLRDTEKKQKYDNIRKNQFMRSYHEESENIPDDIINLFNSFFDGQIPLGMQGNVHVFHPNNNVTGNINPFSFINIQQAMQKPIPIIKTVSVTIEQIFVGIQIPVEIERFIIQNGIKQLEKEIIYVDIPQGTDNGEIIILRDKGNIINENIKGDIKLQINVINNTCFKRNGLDLIINKTITLKEALCGFIFDIKYLNGKTITLNNTKGLIISPEFNKIYNNMGIKRGDHTGSMIIIFHITFPEQLSKEQILKIAEIL